MEKLIHQFMWAFQPHFRLNVEYEVQEVLSKIGLQTNGKVKVLLIGLATEDDMPHQICIEPEDSPFATDDLRSIATRTEELLKADPESGVFHSHPRVHEYRKRELFLRSRARAIAEAIQESGKFEGLTFFASNSTPLAGYDVHTCVGLPYDALVPLPQS